MALVPDNVKYIVVHCSATPPAMFVDAATITRWHREQGWTDIGYHFVILRTGEIQPGRTLDVVGAHVLNFNDVSVGICLVGGVSQAPPRVPQDNFTLMQKRALRRLIESILPKFPKARVVGHHDLDPKKACPSFDAKAWWLEDQK